MSPTWPEKPSQSVAVDLFTSLASAEWDSSSERRQTQTKGRHAGVSNLKPFDKNSRISADSAPQSTADSVRPEGWEGSELEAKALSLRAALTALDAGEPSDPEMVAGAIAPAITDLDTQICTVVGADANLILSAKSPMSFEDCERAMLATVNRYA